jgi:hypothetical protein
MTSPVTKITDYQQRLRDDMLSQFFGDPVHEAISDAIALELQRFENVAYDVLTKRLIDNAVGDILDVFGRIARVDRLGRTDDEYRAVIQVVLVAHDSDGGVDQILWIFNQLTEAVVEYRIYPPASYRLVYETDPSKFASAQQTEDRVKIQELATAAGVGYQLVEGTTEDAGSFRFDVGPGFDEGYFASRKV